MTTTKVNSEFIAVNAISGTIIADGAITSTHLAANCVDSSELVTGSIDTIHIAANQVTATKIVTNGVLTRHISDDQVTADKLANSINTDIATGPAALPKAGGTMTGALAMNANAITSTGDLTLDVATNIVLDADGGGIYFKDGGTTVGFLQNDGGDFRLVTSASDKDFKILGNDGGSTITALTLDMSAAGAATFNSSVNAANLLISGAQGSDGQVLTSTGSGVAWEDAAGGGPTSKTFGTSSIMIGDDATGTIDAANYNTGLGVDVFAALTTGDDNVAVGFGAAGALTTGVRNVFVGEEAGSIGTTTSYSVGIGRESLKNATGNNNTGVGYVALKGLTSGTENTAVGRSAMTGVVTGTYNSVLGYGAGGAITSGNNNTAVGGIALDAITTSSDNTAVGHEALTNASSGAGNTALGKGTMTAVVTGSDNTAVGRYALSANTSASNNVAVGQNALVVNTTGARNTAVGQSALSANLGGEENVSLGSNAGIRNTTGSRNIAIGYRGGRGNTTGSDCVIIGSDASYTNCTGSKNIAIGNNAGYNWTSAYNNTVVGHNARTDEYNSYGAITIGYNGLGYASEHVTFVNGSNKTYVAIGSTNWGGTSDQRLKENIQTSTAGLSFINDLRPITYDWKKKKDIDNSLEAYEADSEDRYIARNGTNNHGFVAQEVKTALDNHSEVLSGSEIWSESKDGTQGISETALIPMLVKALQEADDKIDALTARIETLEG